MVVKHGRGEQDVEQEIGCEQFKLLQLPHASQSFLPYHPYHALSYLSLSHTIGYNARVELSPALKEKAPLNI